MENHICPWWIGYFLINPFRKYVHNPQKILGNYIKPGMRVIDYGCAMGYFSLPMAKMVGESGKVYCFDIQEKMLNKLKQRAKKAGVSDIIEPVLINNNESSVCDEMKGLSDFVLIFAVAHEVPDRKMLFKYLCSMMKKKGLLLFAEPKGHVSSNAFQNSLSVAEKEGFAKIETQRINRSRAVLLKKI